MTMRWPLNDAAALLHSSPVHVRTRTRGFGDQSAFQPGSSVPSIVNPYSSHDFWDMQSFCPRLCYCMELSWPTNANCHRASVHSITLPAGASTDHKGPRAHGEMLGIWVMVGECLL